MAQKELFASGQSKFEMSINKFANMVIAKIYATVIKKNVIELILDTRRENFFFGCPSRSEKYISESSFHSQVSSSRKCSLLRTTDFPT